MKLFSLVLLILFKEYSQFNFPEINIRNTIFDLLVKNNLKEFANGFLGIKEEQICSEKLDEIINSHSMNFQGLFSLFVEI